MRPHGQFLVGTAAALLAVSTLFPIVASLLPPERVRRWAGVLDVALAFGVVVAAMLVETRARALIGPRIEQISYRFYRSMAVLPLVLLVLFFLSGSAIRWEVLLPGIAWRAWVLLYTFPAAAALWVRDESREAEP